MSTRFHPGFLFVFNFLPPYDYSRMEVGIFWYADFLPTFFFVFQQFLRIFFLFSLFFVFVFLANRSADFFADFFFFKCRLPFYCTLPPPIKCATVSTVSSAPSLAFADVFLDLYTGRQLLFKKKVKF